MIVKNEKINFYKYKNKKSLNNHKITGINLPHIIKRIQLLRSKSNLAEKINVPLRKTLLIIENDNMKGNKITEKSHIYRNSQLKMKTITKNDCSPNISKALFYSNYNSLNSKNKDNNNNDFNDNNDINNFYYNFICLGKPTDNKEINKVNSPLIKYFLYNISQSNKKKKYNCAPLNNYYNNSNSQKVKKIKCIKSKFKSPNYSLIGKKLKIKYKNLNCARNNLPNILNNKFSSIPIRPKNTESDDNSSSDKSQFNSFVEATIFKNEKKNIENNNKLYSSLSLFNRIKSFKKKNRMFLNIKETPSKLNFITNNMRKIYFLKKLNINK